MSLYFEFKISQVAWFCFSAGEWKTVPNRWDSACKRSTEPVTPPFGQRNCPEMDSCAQGRAYRKWNHTQYLWLPQGLATHWPGHPAVDRQTVACPKFFTRSATIYHNLRQDSNQSIVLFFNRIPVQGFINIYIIYLFICIAPYLSF